MNSQGKKRYQFLFLRAFICSFTAPFIGAIIFGVLFKLVLGFAPFPAVLIIFGMYFTIFAPFFLIKTKLWLFVIICISLAKILKLSKFDAFIFYVSMGYLSALLYDFLGFYPDLFGRETDAFNEYFLGSSIAFVAWVIMYFDREMPSKSNEHSERLP